MDKKYINWILLITVTFLWGTPYILREIAMESFNHNQVAAFQVFISFLLFTPFILKYFNKITKQNIIPLILSGLTGNIGPSYFFAKAQTQISSSMTGMLNAMLPTITLILALLIFRSPARKKTILGIVLGFVGTLLLVFAGQSQGESYFTGIFFVFMAILSIAVSINLVRFALPDLTGLEIAALAFLFAGPLAGGYLLFTDFSTALASAEFYKSMVMVLLLGTLTFLGVIAYNRLIKQSSHIFAASIAYLIPIVAIFFGVVFGGDTVSIMEIAAIAIILFGVNLTNR